jgi:2,3-bisphosphoglycerate-independent phosphoglycerate mutase
MDGWGESQEEVGNAIKQAKLPFYQHLLADYPHASLVASGEEVGLPAGQMGNSEVGHLNIGAGRIVYQELTRINLAIKNKSFFSNEVLTETMDYVKEQESNLHLMGLLSDGGVHSHLDHLFALLDLAKEKQVSKVYIHCFLDGRDVAPANAGEYIEKLEEKIKELGLGQIASVMGRYYGMDRDNRWDRVQKAYNAMALGEGRETTMASNALEMSYHEKVTDEFVEPSVIVDGQGKARGTIKEKDAIIFFNFRADRAREITRAFIEPEFDGFKRQKGYIPVHYVCMTEYDANFEAFKVQIAYPPQDLQNTLGEVLADHGLKQKRMAETEKYAHVTFFFNGGVEEANPGEDRVLVPSPKVATYNLKPEMSSQALTDEILKTIQSDQYQVIIANYANPDMVGHTGILEAAIKAVESVDHALEQVIKEALAHNWEILVTADHGNAEKMLDTKTGIPYTAHTTNLVPFIVVSQENYEVHHGSLRDIAPTMLEMLGIAKPVEMTGSSLVKKLS